MLFHAAPGILFGQLPVLWCLQEMSETVEQMVDILVKMSASSTGFLLFVRMHACVWTLQLLSCTLSTRKWGFVHTYIWHTHFMYDGKSGTWQQHTVFVCKCFCAFRKQTELIKKTNIKISRLRSRILKKRCVPVTFYEFVTTKRNLTTAVHQLVCVCIRVFF